MTAVMQNRSARAVDMSLTSPNGSTRLRPTERRYKEEPRREVKQPQFEEGKFRRDNLGERQKQGVQDCDGQLERCARDAHLIGLKWTSAPTPGCGGVARLRERDKADDDGDEEHHGSEDQEGARPVDEGCAADEAPGKQDVTPQEEGQGEQEEGLFRG